MSLVLGMVFYKKKRKIVHIQQVQLLKLLFNIIRFDCRLHKRIFFWQNVVCDSDCYNIEFSFRFERLY